MIVDETSETRLIGQKSFVGSWDDLLNLVGASILNCFQRCVDRYFMRVELECVTCRYVSIKPRRWRWCIRRRASGERSCFVSTRRIRIRNGWNNTAGASLLYMIIPSLIIARWLSGENRAGISVIPREGRASSPAYVVRLFRTRALSQLICRPSVPPGSSFTIPGKWAYFLFVIFSLTRFAARPFPPWKNGVGGARKKLLHPPNHVKEVATCVDFFKNRKPPSTARLDRLNRGPNLRNAKTRPSCRNARTTKPKRDRF